MTTLRLAAVAAGVAWLAACDAPKPVPPQGSLPARAEATTLPPTPTASPEPPLPPGHPPMALPGPSATFASPASLPPGHLPLGAAAGGMELTPPANDAGTGAAAVLWTVPKGWVAETPASAMRRAQYRIPGSGGDGECVVFHFGPGQGGDAVANADRWASQFHVPADKAPMKTRETTSGGMKVRLVEVAGSYVGGTGSAEPGERPGYMLLGAIVQGPDANWFFKLTGPEKTVQAQRAAFEEMVRSFKKGA